MIFMKKNLFLMLTLSIFLTNNLQAQQDFTEAFDNIFVNISLTDATTGVLYDRVIPFANLKSKPDTADMYLFLQAYSELYEAAFDINKRLPFDLESLENIISNNTSYVDIGILHYRFNAIDTLVAQQTLYLDANNVLYENRGMGASLYNEDTILLISPLIDEFSDNNITFRFSTLFHFDNTNNPITQLHVDFDDGNGMQIVGLNSTIHVNYPIGDEHVICFIATYGNGLSDTCYAKIAVGLETRGSCTPPPFQTSEGKYEIDKFEGSSAFTGYSYTDYDNTTKSNKGNVWVYYANPDKILRKPVLIVDGFDPGNVRQHESHSNSYADGTCGKSLWAMLKLEGQNAHLGDTLIQKYGYDLVVLDLPDGGGYIERNAMVAIKVIQWINQKLQANNSNHEIVVVGPSMGGQITRYALAYMEAHENIYGNHNCRLWISFDSPHQGANISMGAQAWAYYFRGMYKIGELWKDKLMCTAASQMLILHKSSDAHQKFNKYYNLNNHTIGYPEKMYYPDNLRRVAVSNGSLHGTKCGNGGDRAFRYNPNLGIEQIASSVYLYPEAGQTVKVFDVWHLMPFPPFIIRNHWTETNNTTKCSIDGAPGGLYDTFFQIKDGYAQFGIGVIVLLDKEKHCFMPITSVLDISGNMNYCTNISNQNLVDDGVTPFQSYCGPGSATNMDHVTFNDHIAKWLFNEIETYTTGPRTISICEDASVPYTVHLPAGESSSVNWACSNNLQIILGQGKILCN